MMIQPLQEFNDSIRRGLCLLLTSCFLLGMVALALHHHDGFFQVKNCVICKAKTSLSGAISKVKADIPIAIAAVSHSSELIYLTFSRITFRHQPPFIASSLPNPFLNKAPPFLS
jgi:hypothetical protein